jgi:hypothetical protein
MIPEFRDLSYLAAGSPRQRRVGRLLIEHGVLDRLSGHDPVLAGTIPLGVDLPESDLDILCRAEDPDRFLEAVRAEFGAVGEVRTIGNRPTAVARFELAEYVVELFAQDRPVDEQEGYRHLVVEARLLALGGLEAIDTIRALKAKGLKTEPAFARWLGLTGDPYHALLDLERRPDDTFTLRGLLNLAERRGGR